MIWTHMALWPPSGALSAAEIADILGRWKRRGTAVFLHDGDPKPDRAVSVDVGSTFSIALVNRAVVDDTAWGIAALRWPYAAMVQKEIAEPTTEWTCDLLFAGFLRIDESHYGERTSLVFRLHQLLGPRMRIVNAHAGDVNNRMVVADVAASARAILGCARPEVPGWIDTRVFQYPGAGGLLIHDGAGEFLEPNVHYLRYDRDNPVESIISLVERAATAGVVIRENAFAHVQRHHTWIQRVEVALRAFFGGGA
ncbi:MAG: glycosyltransferase [Myxococcota bacterium]